MALRNHERCRELEDTLRSLERQRIETQNEIARRTEAVGNLRGRVQIERNTLSSLEEAVTEIRRDIARAGGRIVTRPTIGTAISEAVRLGKRTVDEYNRQQAQLRNVEAQLAAEESLLEDARDRLRDIADNIDENYQFQRRNNC